MGRITGNAVIAGVLIGFFPLGLLFLLVRGVIRGLAYIWRKRAIAPLSILVFYICLDPIAWTRGSARGNLQGSGIQALHAALLVSIGAICLHFGLRLLERTRTVEMAIAEVLATPFTAVVGLLSWGAASSILVAYGSHESGAHAISDPAISGDPTGVAVSGFSPTDVHPTSATVRELSSELQDPLVAEPSRIVPPPATTDGLILDTDMDNDGRLDRVGDVRLDDDMDNDGRLDRVGDVRLDDDMDNDGRIDSIDGRTS